MSYFVITPRILECSSPTTGGEIECAVTYDMEEYGLHTGQAQCQFSLARPAHEHDAPSIRVKDLTLSRPLYDGFWRGFYMYVVNTLQLDLFSDEKVAPGTRRFYLSDVHFEPTQRCATGSRIRVCRH